MIAISSQQIEEFSELADETLVGMNEACLRFPVQVSRAWLERTIRRGVRGVKLETIFLCNRRYTSLEAIRRFIERTQNRGQSHEAVPVRPSVLTPAQIEAGRKKFKLPTPLSAK